MRIIQALVERLAKGLGIPEEAMKMFKTANALSGLDRKTLPTELIPLNTLQLSRGLLNFTVLQSLPGWVLPYWAEQQYDPRSPAFVPRSHLGLSINVTWRNWTAVGNPSCPVEPIVDPRGMVMPFPGSWSIDTWLLVDGELLVPSQRPEADQGLVDDIPIVRTAFELKDIRLTLTSWTAGCTLFHRAAARNQGTLPRACRVLVAVRPFNPEGVALIHSLSYHSRENALTINGRDRLWFSQKPDLIRCSTNADGDSREQAASPPAEAGDVSVTCQDGLANGFAAFDFSLDPSGEAALEASVPLSVTAAAARGMIREDEAREGWKRLLTSGMEIVTPEPNVDAVCRASLAALLMLTDGPTITPGPFTYHQFWFRDAAYMLWALDKSGFSSFTRPIIEHYPENQESSGYFRSQKGEWDSNGQALWSVWQHAVLSHDDAVAYRLFDALLLGLQWIEKKRLREAGNEPVTGLLPPGLSAEHLGLSDFYFWDDFWCLAGVEAFGRVCSLLGRSGELERASKHYRSFREDVERAIRRAQQERQLRAIPAGPTRGIDSGMVGSIAAWYPLQLFPADDPRLDATAELLMDRFCVDGMFFQQFIHSGKNPYLTLHIAHGWLWGGMRQRFWDLFSRVLAHASPTLNYPEAIHPLTGGGAMGDGHHGWAAAEIVLALRDAFVWEQWGGTTHRLTLLGGIPAEWYEQGAPFSIEKTAVPEGKLRINVLPLPNGADVEIDLDADQRAPRGEWMLMFPFPIAGVTGSAGEYSRSRQPNGEYAVALRPGSDRIHVSWKRDSS